MEKHKKPIKNNKFKTSVSIWTDELELPDGSYSISDIQHYFEYIFLKNVENINNQLIKIYANKNWILS